MNSTQKYFRKLLGSYTQSGHIPKLIILTIFLNLASLSGQTFTLDVLNISDDGKVSLTISDSNKVSITIVAAELDDEPLPINLHLSEFTGEDNSTIPVYITVPSAGELNPETDKNISISRKLIPLELHVDTLASFVNYTGKLFLTPENGQIKVWEITLTKQKQFTPAELIVDQKEMEFHVHKTFLGIGKEDAINLTVRDKTGEWPLEGLTMTLDEISPSGNNLTIENFDVWINGNKIDDISSWPPRSNSSNYANQIGYRQIPRNGIANIRIGFDDLAYGEYNVTLRFRAVNSTTTETQSIKLKLNVRHSVVWAILILLLAIMISFISTKVISNIRQKSLLQKRISELNHAWLRSEPAYLPVIWVRAMLRQCYKLTTSRWFSSPQLITEKVNQVEEVVNILKKLRSTRITINNLDESDLTKKRLKLELNKIISLIGSDPIDEETKTLINNYIDEFKSTLTIDNITESYWLKFNRCLNDLLNSISLGDIEDQTHANELKKLMDSLYESLNSIPKNMDEIAAVEEIYSKLKILWARRKTDEFQELINNVVQLQSLESFFHVADQAVWEKMKRTKLTITPPQASGPEQFSTFQPLLYHLAADDPIIRTSFLFTRGLTFKWKFEMCESKLENTGQPAQEKKTEVIQCPPLTPVTPEPRVVQFTPWEGLFKASLQITYNGESIILENGKQISQIADESGAVSDNIIEYKDSPITISKSDAFGWYNWLDRTEYTSAIISIFLGVITGLGTYYYAEAGFGSMKDYISLFLWGAGIDQTKNALQIMQTYSKDKAAGE